MVYRPQQRIFLPASSSLSVVTLLDLKRHLRVDGDDEDEVIAGFELAAISVVEKYTQRLLSARSCTLKLPGLPSGQEPIELPGGQVTALASVMVDGVAITGCTFAGDSPALLIPAVDWVIPVATNYPVTITYTAGFATVPYDLILAIKLMVGEWFENRSNSNEGGLSEIPFAARAVMQQWRIRPI